MRIYFLIALTLLSIILVFGCSPSKVIHDLNFASDVLEPYRSLHLIPLQGSIERNSDKATFDFEGCIFAYSPNMTLEGITQQITAPPQTQKAEQTFKIFFDQFQDKVSLHGTWGLTQLADGLGILKDSTLSLQFFSPGTNEHFTAILEPSAALANQTCSSLLTPAP